MLVSGALDGALLGAAATRLGYVEAAVAVLSLLAICCLSYWLFLYFELLKRQATIRPQPAICC